MPYAILIDERRKLFLKKAFKHKTDPAMNQYTRRSSYEMTAGIALFFGLMLVYVLLGGFLNSSSSHPYAYYDILFQLDTPRVISDMTDFEGNHFRTKVHPLYVMFVNPIGVLLAHLLKGREIFVSILLNALFSSLSSLAAFILFQRMAGSLVKPLLLTLIFALSMSQLVLSIIPETSSLATLSLLLTYSIFWKDLYERRVPWTVWLLCGIFSLGVTTTNFGQTLICFTLARLAHAKGSHLKALRSALLFMLSVLAAVSALAIVQKLIYPTANLFFKTASYTEDLKYASFGIFAHPLPVIGQLLKHFFVVNLIAPFPDAVDIGQRLPALTFSSSRHFSWFGFAALFIWATLALTHFDRGHFKKFGWFYAGLALCLMGNWLLHSFYGVRSDGGAAYFLYTGNFTFPAIALLLMRYLFAPGKVSIIGLALLCLSLAANNLAVVDSIIDFYNQANPSPIRSQNALGSAL